MSYAHFLFSTNHSTAQPPSTDQNTSSLIFLRASTVILARRTTTNTRAKSCRRLKPIERLQVPPLEAHVDPAVPHFNLLVRVERSIHPHNIDLLRTFHRKNPPPRVISMPFTLYKHFGLDRREMYTGKRDTDGC